MSSAELFTQRAKHFNITLQSLLPDVDALIYLDTDIVLLSPVDDLWTHFSRFNSTQMVGAAPAREYPNKRDKIRKIPIPGGIGNAIEHDFFFFFFFVGPACIVAVWC